MTDTEMLQAIILKSGYKRSRIAQRMGITRAALNNKINNKSEFKQSEIEALCNILGIKNRERNAIFFKSIGD